MVDYDLEAIGEALKVAGQTEKHNPRYHYWKARYLESIGEERRAAKAYRRALKLRKNILDARERLKELNGGYSLVFPGARPSIAMSKNTVLFALYRMGYRGRMTGHGFRAVASTTLNELGYDADVIERQLAHVEKNKVRAAYHRAEYLGERKKMMQQWADLLDGWKKGESKVIPINSKAA